MNSKSGPTPQDQSMHFAFTRNSYDNCAIKQDETESAMPFYWLTDALQPKACLSTNPTILPYNRAFGKFNVDTESDLLGTTRHLTKCIHQQYNPAENKVKQDTLENCDDKPLSSITTRLQRACNESMVFAKNRFDFEPDTKAPCFFNGLNTRLAYKDSYKKQKEIDRTMDYSKVKPYQDNLKCCPRS